MLNEYYFFLSNLFLDSPAVNQEAEVSLRKDKSNFCAFCFAFRPVCFNGCLRLSKMLRGASGFGAVVLHIMSICSTVDVVSYIMHCTSMHRACLLYY